MSKKIISFIVVYICVSSCSMAENLGFKVPDHDTESLLMKNLDISLVDFLTAYRSKDLTQKRFAQMYLIGLLDATEGSIWCEYSKILPHFIEEYIPIGFKNADDLQLKKRASETILSTMSEYFPCKKTQ